MGFMLRTILLAAWQTSAAGSMRDPEAAIGMLEAQYYQQVDRINAIDPGQLGFVAPKDVQYVAAAVLPDLSFAAR